MRSDKRMLSKIYFITLFIFMVCTGVSFADAPAITEFDYDAPAEGQTTLKAKFDRLK